jgi:hypothetical protein
MLSMLTILQSFILTVFVVYTTFEATAVILLNIIYGIEKRRFNWYMM